MDQTLFRMVLLMINIIVVFAPSNALGHGDPIDLFVNSETNRLEVQGEFEIGVFVDEGSFLLTDRPGVQVSTVSNGMTAETAIGYVLTQGLLYWDGIAAAPTNATLQVVPPVGIIYTVDADTGLQTGMTWGVYDGTPGWHRHGDYLLSAGAPDGVYGLAVQFVAEDYGPSQPVLVPFVLGSWSESEIDDAIGLLSAEVQTIANPDFNNDGLFDAQDLSAWELGYGTGQLAGHGQGDADGDSDVDGNDFLAWQRQSTAAPSTVASAASVPEPFAAQLVLTALLLSSCCRSCGRGSWGRRRC